MPPANTESDSVFRFGAFELDARTGELRCDHAPVRLAPQPLKILVSLASHPGQLQTRKEIQDLVWRGRDFCRFELGLNYCLNQIRRALGDDARTPRYIETVPRRGYRFIAAVQREDKGPQGALAVPPSIAVLPFANLSADRRTHFLVTG